MNVLEIYSFWLVFRFKAGNDGRYTLRKICCRRCKVFHKISLQEYVNELRQLESKIEAIRTGDEIGDALAVLSDEDAEVVSTNIQGMIEGFINLGQDVADAKDR